MMARRIATFCDVCLSDGVEAPAATLPGWGARTLDLCAMHEVELYKPLADALDAFGVSSAAADSPATAAAEPIPLPELVCPMCGRDYRERTRSAFMQHMKTKHDMSAADVRAAAAS